MVKSNFYLITLFCKHNEVVIKVSSTSGLLRESLNVVCTRGFLKYKNIVMVVFTFCHLKKPIKWSFKKFLMATHNYIRAFILMLA